MSEFRPSRPILRGIVDRYGRVIFSVTLAIAASIPLRGYAYPRPLALLALVLSTWGQGLGPGLLGAGLATVMLRLVFPDLEPALGLVSDAAMFGLAAVIFSAFSGAKVRAEQALRESEARLKLVETAAHLGVWDRDLHTDRISTFGDYGHLHGLAPDHSPLTFEQWLNLVHPGDRARMQERIRECLEQTRVWDQEFRVLWPDGSAHWLLSKGTVYVDGGGRPQRMVGVSLDITPRKNAEAALRESEERFRRVFEEGPLGLALVGRTYRFLKVNSALCGMVGYTEEELTGLSFEDITHPEDLEKDRDLAARLFRREISNYKLQKRYLKKNGDIIWIHLTAAVIRDSEGEPLYGLAMIEDITAARHAQEEAMVRQKLESIGVLAGGIAHDFNNLLGGVLAKAELAEAEIAKNAFPAAEVESIKQLAIRAAEIVRELMIFSGQEGASLEPVDVSRLVEEMLALLKVSISKHTMLKTDLSANPPAVLGNAPQIRQMVMNLVINASEAIGENSGVVTVTTSRVAGTSAGPNSSSRDYLRLEVSDTGCGMAEEQKGRIFDPFFTTKSAGRGLGLSVVSGIVQSHGGKINVVSAPDHGTTFCVLLPCTDQSVTQPRQSLHPSLPRQKPEGCVLLVEDEEALRVATCKMLVNKGFSVIQAGDGSTAIDLIRSQEDLKLILLDMTIPGLSSREVIAEAQRVRPDLKIILTSAYSQPQATRDLDAPQVCGFIRKPYLLADLAQLLSDSL